MAGDDFTKALEDSREIELTVIGRTSGRAISNPVWFVQDGETLYLVPVSGSDSNWYKNILKTPTIRLADQATQLKTTATTLRTPPRSNRSSISSGPSTAAYYPKQDVAVEVPLT